MPDAGVKRPIMLSKEQQIRLDFLGLKLKFQYLFHFGHRIWTAYKLRLKRQRFLFRAWRKSYQLRMILNRTSSIKNRYFVIHYRQKRNTKVTLFLNHHRALGICHFIVVDNDSCDGTLEYLKAQSDISIWQTEHSYKLSRFGVDWLTWLMIKYGHGH